MLIALKIALLASLFVVTGGALFRRLFARHRALAIAAAGVAIVASGYLMLDIYNTIRAGFGVAGQDAAGEFDPRRFKIDADGFGFVQIGMSLSDAYAALGLERFRSSDLSGYSVSDSACFPVAPQGGRLGIEFLVVQGRIGRIDITSPSIETREGIRIGSPATDIELRYPRQVTIEPHKYIDGGLNYTVQPLHTQNILLFEVEGGRVTRYRVGARPTVLLVERCL